MYYVKVVFVVEFLVFGLRVPQYPIYCNILQYKLVAQPIIIIINYWKNCQIINNKLKAVTLPYLTNDGYNLLQDYLTMSLHSSSIVLNIYEYYTLYKANYHVMHIVA